MFHANLIRFLGKRLEALIKEILSKIGQKWKGITISQNPSMMSSSSSYSYFNWVYNESEDG